MIPEPSILWLLLKNPDMTLTEIQTCAVPQASYNYVWATADEYGLLEDEERAIAASVAAPYLEDPDALDKACESLESLWVSTHVPSHVPSPSEVETCSPSPAVLRPGATICVLTDHGAYYRVNPDPQPHENLTDGKVRAPHIIEIYDPNTIRCAERIQVRKIDWEGYCGDSVPVRWISSNQISGFKNTEGSIEAVNATQRISDRGFDSTYFYSKPEIWGGFTMGDLKKSLDRCVMYHLDARGESLSAKPYSLADPVSRMVLIEKKTDSKSRIVTTDGQFMRWESCPSFPFVSQQKEVKVDYYVLRDMLNVYYSLYADDPPAKVENEPVMISHGSPSTGLRISAGQVCMRTLEPYDADLFPSYADVIPQAVDTVPYARVNKSSLVAALQSAISGAAGENDFVLRLDTCQVGFNVPINFREQVSDMSPSSSFVVTSYGPNPPKTIGLPPKGVAALKEFSSIVASIPTEHIIISGSKDHSSNIPISSVVMLSEDSKIPDIADPGSSGVAFRAAPIPKEV